MDLWAVAQHLWSAPAAVQGTALKTSLAQRSQPGKVIVSAARRLRDFAREDPARLEPAVAMLLSGTLKGVVKHLSANASLQVQAVTAVHVLSSIEGTARIVIAATPGCLEALAQLLNSSELRKLRHKAWPCIGKPGIGLWWSYACW